jgi:hypothetical protein
VTTILPMFGESGSTLFWLRSSTSDSCDARRARPLLALMTAFAFDASTYGFSNSPSRNFNVRTRSTAWSMRCVEIQPLRTAVRTAAVNPW